MSSTKTKKPHNSVQEKFLQAAANMLEDDDRPNFTRRVMNELSQGCDTRSERIVFLPRTALRASPHEKKVYDIEKLGSDGQDASLMALALDISRRGIQSPLRVIPISSDEYEIVSGHRRNAANSIAVEKLGYSAGEEVPCIIEPRPSEERDFETTEAMILDNLQRDKSDYEHMMEIIELQKCFEKRKALGENITSVRERVKESLGISDTEITRYNKIHGHLNCALVRDFHDGRIASTVAYEIAKMEPEQQLFVSEYWDRVTDSTLTLALLNAIMATFIADNAGTVVSVPTAQKAKSDKPSVPMPRTINEGVEMLDAAFHNIRRTLTTPFKNMDSRTQRRLLKQISKQMAQMLASQKEFALLLGLAENSNEDGDGDGG